jgi:energy-coupling factor transport system ATP-binding protein
MSFIELEGVSYVYPGASGPALENVNLSVAEGEYLALVGRNGSGKSTLLRLLDGLRAPSAGEVRVDGIDTRDIPRAASIRSSVALVFQAPLDQIVSSVVEEDVAFGPENLGLPRREIEARIGEALAATGLEKERRSPSLFLSAGQQQRLAIAGALALRPRCIAFDEATAMLDPSARLEVLALIDRLVAAGLTVVHATHDMAEASRAGRLVALEKGRVVFDGSPAGFFMPSEGGQPAAHSLGFSLPACPALALALELPPVLREDAAGLASRIVDRAAARAMPASRVAGPPSGAAQAASAGSADAVDVGAGAPAADTAFELADAGYAYLKGTTNERRALSGISVAVPKGSLVALVGRTGSGKSSILQMLDGLAFPTEGRAAAFGEDTAARATDVRRLRMRAPLAVQRPESALFEVYAGDDVAFGPRNLGLAGKVLVERVRRSMNLLGLPFDQFRDRGTRELSGGEKRRLALAGVLALEPDALLLDEPTSALDPETRTAVLDLIRALSSSGKTIVFATHSMEEAALADFVGVVAEGRLVSFDRPGRVFYELYDPGWAIGRPFACQVALALGDRGLPVSGRPLSSGELATSLAPVMRGAEGLS